MSDGDTEKTLIITRQVEDTVPLFDARTLLFFLQGFIRMTELQNLYIGLSYNISKMTILFTNNYQKILTEKISRGCQLFISDSDLFFS